MNSTEDVIYSIQRILIIVLSVIIAISVPILSAIYYHYRRHPILKARRAEWAIMNQLFLMIAAIIYGYDGWRHYPSCAHILFTNSVMAMVVLDSHIIRCWLLLYNWNVSKALCAFKSGEIESEKNWWLNNTHLASDKVMAKVMASLIIFHLGCWLIFVGINGWDKSWDGPADAAICTSPLLWFFGVWGALACLMTIAVYLSYNMRLVVDAFEIKNELMTTGGIWIVGAMPFWLVALLFPSLEQNLNFIIMTALSVPICTMRVIYLSLVKPLMMLANELNHREYVELSTVAVAFGSGTTETPEVFAHTTGTVRAREKSRKVELRKMLDTNTGIASAFINFLTKEFSVENWKFYSDVLQLRMTYGGWRDSDAGRSGLESGHMQWFRAQGSAILSLEEKINRIYSMYLAKSAAFEVNLGSERMLSLQACFGPDRLLRPERMDDIPEMLCRAQDEIYELMRTDSYERFKKTADFDQAQLALV